MISISPTLLVYAIYAALAARGVGHVVQLVGMRAGPEGQAWRVGDRLVWWASYAIIGLGIAALAGVFGR